MSGRRAKPGDGDTTAEQQQILQETADLLLARSTDNQETDAARLRQILQHEAAGGSWLMELLRRRASADGPEGYVGVTLAAVADRMPRGLLLVTATGRVLHANAAARDLEADQLWSRDEDGAVRLPDAEAAALLRDKLSAFAAAAAGAGAPPAFFRVRDAEGRLRLFAALDDPRPGPEGSQGWPELAPFVAVLTLSRPQTPPHLPMDALQALFGLSPAEARLAAAFARGEALQDYAARTGVAIPTVRTQFAQVKRKLDARHQAEVVSILMTALPVTGGLG